MCKDGAACATCAPPRRHALRNKGDVFKQVAVMRATEQATRRGRCNKTADERNKTGRGLTKTKVNDSDLSRSASNEPETGVGMSAFLHVAPNSEGNGILFRFEQFFCLKLRLRAGSYCLLGFPSPKFLLVLVVPSRTEYT